MRPASVAAALRSDDVADDGTGRTIDLGLDPLAVSEPVLRPEERLVLDTRPADEFFEAPAIGVSHADRGFEQRLLALYRRVLGPLSGDPGAALLDLCSSWTSHLPPELQLRRVLGHGVNAAELAANGCLSSSFVQDLNRRTRLPLPSASLRAVLCCNGLQYLSRPEWVMVEVRRVLRPGGLLVVTFSDYCWAERATAGWLSRSSEERLRLVARLLESAGLRVVEVMTAADAVPVTSASTSSANGCSSNSSSSGSTAGSGGSGPCINGGSTGDALYAVVALKPAESPGQSSPLQHQGALDFRSTEDGDPAETANGFLGPALQEMDLLSGLKITPAVLERWWMSYNALVDDAVQLGIPRSALPSLPPSARAEEIREARDHVTSVIASFLSAGL